MIEFTAEPREINGWLIIRLTKEASAKLPSRGQVMVEGSINDVPIKLPLEPDGNFGHFLVVDDNLRKTGVEADKTAELKIEPVKDWPEPELPADLAKALSADAGARATWDKATPMAHWEWLRWIRSTGNRETHDHRIEVGMSKLKKGERRPCCWNRNLCTFPEISKSGVLLEPSVPDK